MTGFVRRAVIVMQNLEISRFQKRLSRRRITWDSVKVQVMKLVSKLQVIELVRPKNRIRSQSGVDLRIYKS